MPSQVSCNHNIGASSSQFPFIHVSLPTKSEKVPEETIQGSKGDIMYFWAHLDIDGGAAGTNDALTFWSMCDMLNAGQCRSAFENTFCNMYSMPSDMEARPPMPKDDGH